jgi:hypothetical protein
LHHPAGSDDYCVKLPLAGERTGQRLVDKGHALVDYALGDQCRPDLAEGP